MALNRLASYKVSASFSLKAVTTTELRERGTRFALLYLVCSPSKVTLLTDAFLYLIGSGVGYYSCDRSYSEA